MSFTFAYGLMSSEFATASQLASPAHTGAPQADIALAIATRDIAAGRIAQSLWPMFNRSSAPSPLDDRFKELLKADFDILRRMAEELHRWEPHVGNVWLLAYNCEDTWYEQISTTVIDGQNMWTYRTDLPASFARSTGLWRSDKDLNELGAAFSAKTAYSPLPELRNWMKLSLKHLFQRPRPYQCAYDVGIDSFEHLCSISAHSPSLPSGHAYDSALAAIVGAAEITGATASEPLSSWKTNVDDLPAWTAQFGDRRNYAGLHFPSDNWASWIAVATVIEKMFSPSAVASANQRLKANIQASKCFQYSESVDEYRPAKQVLVSLLGNF